MVDICLYFQVHQPKRLRKYTYFDIGHNHFYEDDVANREIFLKVAHKCYLPATAILLNLINKYQGKFKIAFSLSGVFVEQAKLYSPETIQAFNKLAKTRMVEFLNETYYHSLSFLFSKSEFIAQVKKHREMIKNEFGFNATTFRNTELIYNNDLANVVEKLGYNTILAEGADKILGWRSANYIYQPSSCQRLKLLLRNYRLTDDVGFRFSQKSWVEYPINAEKYSNWLHALEGQADVINLFMDFETFGEHQWRDSGIFEFLTHLPAYVMRNDAYKFSTPEEVVSKHKTVATIDSTDFFSWADEDRGLSAWCGNHMQEDALTSVYEMESQVLKTKNQDLINTWRSLLTSDHFYYMCTKYANDGDVHKYFNPYHNAYDAYINYQNVLADFRMQLATVHSYKPTILHKIRRFFPYGSKYFKSKKR